MSRSIARPLVVIPVVALGLTALYLHYWGKKL